MPNTSFKKKKKWQTRAVKLSTAGVIKFKECLQQYGMTKMRNYNERELTIKKKVWFFKLYYSCVTISTVNTIAVSNDYITIWKKLSKGKFIIPCHFILKHLLNQVRKSVYHVYGDFVFWTKFPQLVNKLVYTLQQSYFMEIRLNS